MLVQCVAPSDTSGESKAAKQEEGLEHQQKSYQLHLTPKKQTPSRDALNAVEGLMWRTDAAKIKDNSLVNLINVTKCNGNINKCRY